MIAMVRADIQLPELLADGLERRPELKESRAYWNALDKERRAEGVPLLEAATEGARLRFRPVMMTSFAFILGLLPLVIAEGPSRLARRDVGTPVFGGMITASFIGIFAIPALYVTFQYIRERLRPSTRPVEKNQHERVPADHLAE